MTAGRQDIGILTALCALMLVLGSVHAFSVFLIPLEAAFEATRTLSSLTYSLALLSITASVLVGHRLYARWRPARFVFGLCLLGTIGLVAAAIAPTLWLVWLGYGLLFGVANGLGYGFSLQFSAQVMPGREGLAMGVVTAAYALGAALAPVPLSLVLEGYGPSVAFAALGLVLSALALAVSAYLLWSGRWFRGGGDSRETPPASAPTALLWIGYGGAVAAGLMVIGHAAGIVDAGGLPIALWTAPALLAAANMLGSFLGGLLIDRLSVRVLFVLLPLATAAGAAGLLAAEGTVAVLAGLGLIGAAYGATIAVYPAAINRLFGAAAGIPIYGRVFTAWGLAGLGAPWLAGALYDRSGAYSSAFLVALGLALLSIAAGLILRRRMP